MKKYESSFNIKHCLLFFTLIFSFTSTAQKIRKEFTLESYTVTQYDSLRILYGNKKTIPQLFEKQILIALSYFPELKQSKIVFRIKHAHSPLSARPMLLSAFLNNKNRTYIITISDSVEKLLAPILFNNLSFNAQVGVIGHEISHTFDFSKKNTFELTRLAFGTFSQGFLDRFEFQTDSICIAHGLGYQLLSWSTYVRKVLMIEYWNGADNIHQIMTKERYMNPKSIQKRIDILPQYID